MRVEEEMLKASKPAVGVKVGDSVTGTIYNILPEGFFIFYNQRFLAFCIAVKFPAGVLDFGQEITARITYIREDGRVNLSLRQQKENSYDRRCGRYFNFYIKRNGKMPLL